jgi:N-acetylglucosamine-6-sulfatase
VIVFQTVEALKVMTQTRRLLGSAGTTFGNSFVSLSLTAPSRATFLTGQYAHNHGCSATSCRPAATRS